MLIIQNKKTKELLYSKLDVVELATTVVELLPSYDASKMEFGISELDTLPDHFKIEKERIIELSFEEMIDEGIVPITSVQKIVKGSLQIKSVKEQLDEGTIKLLPNQKLDKNEIVDKSPLELCESNLIELSDFKEIRLTEFSNLSFQKREKLIPDYKLQNASLGVYDEQKIENYRKTISAFRAEFKRIESKIKEAKNSEEIEKIRARFPEKIIEN